MGLFQRRQLRAAASTDVRTDWCVGCPDHGGCAIGACFRDGGPNQPDADPDTLERYLRTLETLEPDDVLLERIQRLRRERLR